MTDLSGKVAMITGAASGIGLASVEAFVEKGANVIAADMQEEAGKSLETRFGSDRVRFFTCDVTSDADLQNALSKGAEAFGCLLYTSPSPRDQRGSRMPSSA